MPRLTRLRLAAAVLLASGATVGGAAVVAAQDAPSAAAAIEISLNDGQGDRIGTVDVVPSGRTLDITVRTRGVLRTGFHGFHIHAVGRCEGPTFMSAGPHFERPGQDHGQHAADLPTVLVKANGTALLRVTTDLVTLDELRDADGAAFIVHLNRDNQANIPPRYGQPDKETLDTGDSGGRAACGVVPGTG